MSQTPSVSGSYLDSLASADTMDQLYQAILLGLIIASPQLWHSLRYYPRSVRSQNTYEDKVSIGSIPLHTILRNLLTFRNRSQIDGVFHPEVVCYTGIVALPALFISTHPLWWMILILSISLAMGRHFPLFRWTHWLHLRNPSRYCYFISLALCFLTLEAPMRGGFSGLRPSQPILQLLLCLTAADLLLASSYLWPMRPYCQRWERPECIFASPLASFLAGKPGRVSGLPYPLRTGQINRIKTLGYAGASCPQWMRDIRKGTHDWFLEDKDGQRLDDYGVTYAYTYRPLRGKWKPTAIPHLYQNTALSS